MRAADYLEQVGKMDGQIHRKIRLAEHWREMAYKITAVPGGNGHSQNRMTDAPYERCIVRADELEREVAVDMERLAEMKFEVEAKICMVSDEVSQDILRLRYVELFRWEEVISIVDRSRSHVFRKHSLALEELDRILGEK